MSQYPRLVLLGVANGTNIQADVTTLGSAVPVSVTLTASYALANPRPPGFPFRPSMTGATAANLDYPRTIPSGTVLEVLACEADALVAAGVATLN